MTNHGESPEDIFKRRVEEQGDKLPANSYQPSDTAADLLNQLREQLRSDGVPLGATGAHPQGFLTPKDEGEIRFGVACVEGKVVIDFGKPVAWIGMEPTQAVELGNLLIKHGRKAAKR